MDPPVAAFYTQHYEAGWRALKSVMLLGGQGYRFAGPWRSWKARQAIKHFEHCLTVKPDCWQCMWAVGKARQALGHDAAALDWFERAVQIETANADVVREASLQAGFVGNAAKAQEYARRALQLKPSDNTLRANLAMALLIGGNISEALAEARRAALENPKDRVNARILLMIEQVASGEEERPTRLPKYD